MSYHSGACAACFGAASYSLDLIDIPISGLSASSPAGSSRWYHLWHIRTRRRNSLPVQALYQRLKQEFYAKKSRPVCPLILRVCGMRLHHQSQPLVVPCAGFFHVAASPSMFGPRHPGQSPRDTIRPRPVKNIFSSFRQSKEIQSTLQSSLRSPLLQPPRIFLFSPIVPSDPLRLHCH